MRPSAPACTLAIALATCLAGCAPSPVRAPELVRLAGDARVPLLDEPDREVVATTAAAPSPKASRLVIVTLDGVRWQDVFEGVDPRLAEAHHLRASEIVSAAALTPNLHRAMARGVALGGSEETPLAASGPNFASLPGYVELLSGRPSSCQRNDCAKASERTILDACRELPDTTDDDVTMIGSWETLERAAGVDTSRMVISTGRHHGSQREHLRRDRASATLLRRGEKAFPPPGQNDYRPDRLTAPLALEVLATKKPRCLFVGLGDSDEHAHLGDYRSYLRALAFADRFVGDVLATLDAMGEAGAKTTIVITTDHGREASFVGHGARAPESARVWLVAAGAGVDRETFRGASRLADVAPVLASLLGATLAPPSSAVALRSP